MQDLSKFYVENDKHNKGIDGAENTVQSEAFDLEGKNVSPDHQRCVAKRVGRQCWVKFVNKGPDKGHMVNPLSPNWEPNRISEKNPSGDSIFVFQKVTDDSYHSYLRFLKTRNPMHIRHAERDMIVS